MTAVAALVAFAVVWGWCELLQALLPAPAAGFRGQMKRTVVLMLARIAGVLAVVALGAAVLRASAPGCALGAVAGWLAGAGRQAWRDHRTMARDAAAEGPRG